MSEELVDKLKKSIDKLENKKIKIFLFVQDTKGNPKASIRVLYESAYALKKEGYEIIILHDKKDYIGVGEWLDEKYMKEITHLSVEGTKLEVSPEDILVIPEIFGGIMEQVAKMPCAKVVFSQAYDHIFETLQPGMSWAQLGFNRCITTSDEQIKIIQNVMKNINIEVVQPLISEVFSKKSEFPKPIIGVHTREQRVGLNIIKEFYMKYPHFRWVTFRDLRGLSEIKFANAMDETMLSVWVDPNSSFGTFPLESMKKGIPVLGQVPSLVPNWMNENNGIWVQNPITIVDALGEFIQNWLEDNINESLYESMKETINGLTTIESFEEKIKKFFEDIIEERKKAFKANLNKLNETVDK